MKNLKTFEKFFNFYLYSKVTKTKELWGYSREDIEDLFLEVNDRYGLPISISFTTTDLKYGGTTISVDDKDINTIKRGIKLGTTAPSIQVNIFTNPEWCNKFCGEEVDFPVHFVNGEYHEDLAKKMYDGFNKISDDIENMIPQLQKRLPEYKIKFYRSLDIDNTYQIYTNGIAYGRSFFNIYMVKK